MGTPLDPPFVSGWAPLRVAGGAAILAFVVVGLGTGPVVNGLRHVGWGPVVAAYYRSQFLNATLTGGVVGGLYRAVVHGRRVGDVGPGLRAVAPVCLAVVLLVASTRLRGGAPCAPAGRFGRALTGDLYRIVVRRAAPRLVVLSIAALACHAALFMVAAATTGVPLPPRAALVAGLLVLLAAAVPVNAAGWGPREGTAAWAFGMLGETPEPGAGAAVLVAVRRRRDNGLRSTEPADVLPAGRDADG